MGVDFLLVFVFPTTFLGYVGSGNQRVRGTYGNQNAELMASMSDMQYESGPDPRYEHVRLQAALLAKIPSNQMEGLLLLPNGA